MGVLRYKTALGTWRSIAYIKGDKGDQGDPGDPGTPGTNATITGMTATVDNNVGTPAVTVTEGGTPSARSFDLAFSNLKGSPGTNGTNGTNATITSATASVDGNVGTPAVTVTLGGTESARTFDFAFSNLKGDQGDPGTNGQDGAPGANPTSFTVTLSSGAWSSGVQTVSDARFISSGYTYLVSAASASVRDWQDADIYASDVTSDGYMTFNALVEPSVNLTANVIRLELGA